MDFTDNITLCGKMVIGGKIPTVKQCSKCKLCMESGGQTYVERCQADGFRDHLWRIPNEDGRYHYEVEYLVDPQASPL